MWSDMSSVLTMILSVSQSLFALYSSIWFLSGVLVLFIVRRILKTFNLI